MKYSVLILSVLAVTSSVSAQNFSLDIKGNKLPKTVIARDFDGLEVPKECYKNGTTSDGWMVSSVGNTLYALISPSHSHVSEPQDNRLSIQPLMIEEGAILSWEARSVYSDFPDTYKITAQSDGREDTVTLFEGTAEDIFTPHCVSLKEFEGKSTIITFICNSDNGYILAIKDVFAGVPLSPKLAVTDETLRFNGEGSPVLLKGSIFNSGAKAEIKDIIITLNGTDKETVTGNFTISTGETYNYSCPVEPVLNEKTAYTIEFVGPEGNVLQTVDGNVMVSHFERNHFVDEGTGTWCNSCPAGTIGLKKLERQYPGQMSIVCTHIGTDAQDPFVNHDYMSGLSFYAVPYMMLNRIRSTSSSTTDLFEQALWEPTEMSLSLDRNEDEVKVSLYSAADMDNSADRYRLGYVLTADYYQTESIVPFYQKNIYTTTNHEEYYFLPTLIQAHLVKFRHINLDGQGYFEGIPGSVPASISGEGENKCLTLRPDVPEDEHISNPTLHVYIVDNQTGAIKNTRSLCLADSQATVPTKNISPEADNLKVHINARQIKVEGSGSVDITVHSIDGRLLARFDSVMDVLLPEGICGPCIVRAVSEEGTDVKKVVF